MSLRVALSRVLKDHNLGRFAGINSFNVVDSAAY